MLVRKATVNTAKEINPFANNEVSHFSFKIDGIYADNYVALSNKYLVMSGSFYGNIGSGYLGDRILVWDVRNSQISAVIQENDLMNAHYAILGHDNSHFLTRCNSKIMHLWDVTQTQQPLKTFSYEELPGYSTIIQVLNDKQRYLRFKDINFNPRLGLWDMDKPEAPITLFNPQLHDHKNGKYWVLGKDSHWNSFKRSALLLLPDQEHFIGGVTDDGVMLWNLNQPEKPKAVFKNPSCYHFSKFSLTLDQTKVFGHCQNGNLHLWDIQKAGEPLATFKLSNYDITSSIVALNLLPDGKHFAVHYFHEGVWLWNINNAAKPVAALTPGNGWEGLEFTYLDYQSNLRYLTRNGFSYQLIPSGSDNELAIGQTIDNLKDQTGLRLSEIKPSIPHSESWLESVANSISSYFSSTSMNMLDTSAPESVHPEADFYKKANCRPIEFYGKAGVVCSDEHTTVINIPIITAPLFEKVGENIMLAAVFLNWTNRFINWCKSKTAAQELKSSLSKENFAEAIEKLQEKLTRIYPHIDALKSKHGEDKSQWAVFAIEEHYENLNQLIDDYAKGNIEESSLKDFNNEFDHFEKDILEELNVASESVPKREVNSSVFSNPLNRPLLFSFGRDKSQHASLNNSVKAEVLSFRH